MKDLVEAAALDAGARVDHVDPSLVLGLDQAHDQFGSRLLGCRRTACRRLLFNRLRRVDHQIEQRLLEQTFVHPDHDWMIGQLRPQNDPVLIALRVKEVRHLRDDAGQITWLGVEFDLAGELEEVGEDPPKPLRFARQGIEPRQEPVTHLGGQLGIDDRLAEQLGGEADRGEWILDLVSQASGHGAQLREPLGVAGASLGLARSPLTAPQKDPQQRQHSRYADRRAQGRPP